MKLVLKGKIDDLICAESSIYNYAYNKFGCFSKISGLFIHTDYIFFSGWGWTSCGSSAEREYRPDKLDLTFSYSEN
jgi:hypothetical protein